MELFSHDFYHFFKSIPDNIYTLDEMIACIAKLLPDIADRLHIGKMQSEFDMPVTSFSPKGKKDYGMLYCCASGFQDSPIHDVFSTSGPGVLTLTSYPKINIHWSDEEIDQIHTLHKCIFIYTSRAKLVDTLHHAVTTDTLTGVLSTPGLMEFLGKLIAQHHFSEYTAMFMNIKNMKYVNQTYADKGGDEVLRKYALRIKDFLEPSEAVARLGGDNFLVLVKKTRMDLFLQYISAITVHINLGHSVQTLAISSRIGIYPINEADTINEVMNRTSIALAVARKSIHHDHIWFREDMIIQSIHAKSVTGVFSSAIDNKEFIAYYQPKVNLVTQKLCGCEALVRWIRNGELVSPIDFVPILENEGSICVLDFYILECVCKDLRRWIDQGLEPVRVSVNFSKVHLHNKQLDSDIMSVLDRYHIDSKYIEIELTESSGYKDFDALTAFVNAMQKHGIYTSIDDFGTGYSSLNLIKDLPVNVIKLDRSFVKDIPNSSSSDTIVIKSLIQMAGALGMEVVCEGVETLEQAAFLKNLNCPVAQGYLFDKPLSVEDFEHRLIDKTYHKEY